MAPIILIPYLLVLLVPTILTLFVESGVETRLGSWGDAILAMVALYFTYAVLFPAASLDSLVGELISIGFAFQFLMVILTTTLLNPRLAPRLGDKDVIAEILVFLRWGLPLGLIGTVVTCLLINALAPERL